MMQIQKLPRWWKRPLRLWRVFKRFPLLIRWAAPLASWGFVPEGVLFLHGGRSGSSVVADLLGQHPRLVSYGEMFKGVRYPGPGGRLLSAGPENMLKAARLAALGKTAVVEVKFLQRQHLARLGVDLSDFLDMARRAGFRRFIILERRNALCREISLAVAASRGQFNFRLGQSVPRTKVTLPVEALVERFQATAEQYRVLRERLRDDRVLELGYEEDIKLDPHVAYGRVCHWLGLEAPDGAVRFVKASGSGPNQAVENWDEVVSALQGTGYAWMLEGR